MFHKTNIVTVFKLNLRLNFYKRMRGPDSHLLAARHDPAIISQCPDEGNTSSEPPRKLSLLNLLQMSKDISAGMEYLASKVR